MAEEVVMPRLSDTMDAGTVGKWLKKEGDQIKKGEIIAEIETDKANMELESYANGILAEISVSEGQSAGVGEPIAVIAASAEEAKKIKSGSSAPASDGKSKGQASTEPKASESDQPPPAQGPPAAPQKGEWEPAERIKASPLARRIAQERGIDLMDVAGTGPGGRITKDDVQSFLTQVAPIGREEGELSAKRAVAPPSGRSTPPPPVRGVGQREPQPAEMTRMQGTIARRMTQARFSAPEFVLTAEFDMTEARDLLQRVKSAEDVPGIGPNDLLIKAVAGALDRHREVNAGWEGDGIVHYGRINVGFAVAIQGGLVVPVIGDADRKPLGEIARESKSLIDKARNNKLVPSEYEGGTFTISNLGMYGIEQFTPIINVPEACIMGVGAMEQKPVVVDGQIVVRDRMRVNLACDHRVVNGAQGAEFLATLRRLLENPALALL